MRQTKLQALLSTLSNGSYALLCLILVLGLSWLSLARFDYLYGLWHDHGGIAENIEQFGPQNRFRADFQHTSRSERLRVFGEITSAVHSRGEGLAEIRYQPENTSFSSPLLHRDEILHLQDVARLIHWLKWGLFAVALCWLAWTGLALGGKTALPSLRQQALSLLTVTAIAVGLLGLFGFEKVFYQLHIWIFPEEHRWFFYYQDSLMSTMMAAPSLFAYIGVSIALLALPLYILLVMTVSRLNRR